MLERPSYKFVKWINSALDELRSNRGFKLDNVLEALNSGNYENYLSEYIDSLVKYQAFLTKHKVKPFTHAQLDSFSSAFDSCWSIKHGKMFTVDLDNVRTLDCSELEKYSAEEVVTKLETLGDTYVNLSYISNGVQHYSNALIDISYIADKLKTEKGTVLHGYTINIINCSDYKSCANIATFFYCPELQMRFLSNCELGVCKDCKHKKTNSLNIIKQSPLANTEVQTMKSEQCMVRKSSEGRCGLYSLECKPEQLILMFMKLSELYSNRHVLARKNSALAKKNNASSVSVVTENLDFAGTSKSYKSNYYPSEVTKVPMEVPLLLYVKEEIDRERKSGTKHNGHKSPMPHPRSGYMRRRKDGTYSPVRGTFVNRHLLDDKAELLEPVVYKTSRLS